ncbi:MAG: sulfatase family protein [Solirubrobacterales bacterium]
MAAAAFAAALAMAIPLGGRWPASPEPVQAAPREGAQGKPTKAKRKRERLREMRRKNRRQKRPNVIVVMTDDQNESMQGLPSTARLLGGRGTTFANSYVSFPLCCPSRATFLTGQYAHNHGVISTDLPNGYNGLDHANTLAVWLRSSGYRTAMVGKYLNGYGIDDGIPEPVTDAMEIPPGWADWFALTSGLEQRRYKYKVNDNGRIRWYKRATRNYVTDVLASRAVDFVKRQAPKPKPFFLWFNPTAPHGEAGVFANATRDPLPAPRHMGAAGEIPAPRPPNFDEEDVSDKPAAVQERPRLSNEEIADIDRRHRGRIESLLAVDEAVARLIGRVRKAGDKRKTYVFFTSDNGVLLGAHRLIFKNFLYEESLRVPLIVRGPGFPAGAIRSQPVSNVDLAPTITQLAKARPGLAFDGRSLLPVARDPVYGAERELLFESQAYDGSAGIRSGRWVYLDDNAQGTELYDLSADPFQLESLHASTAHEAIRDQLAARLAQIRTCAGASCP